MICVFEAPPTARERTSTITRVESLLILWVNATGRYDLGVQPTYNANIALLDESMQMEEKVNDTRTPSSQKLDPAGPHWPPTLSPPQNLEGLD